MAHSLQKSLQLPFDSAHHGRPPIGEGRVQLYQGGSRPDLLQSVLPTADTANPNDGDSACREAQGNTVRKGRQRENQELSLASVLRTLLNAAVQGTLILFTAPEPEPHTNLKTQTLAPCLG